MQSEELVLAFCRDVIYTLARSNEHESCRFGGPMERRFTGVEFGPSPLHLVAELDLHVMTRTGLHPLPVFTLPLIYGFQYSGCELTYRVKPTGWIDVIEMWPEGSSDDFPYLNYPRLLPYAPLRVSSVREASYAEFAEQFPNVAGDQPAELVVCVPPPATVGVSLWGSGDGRRRRGRVRVRPRRQGTVKAHNRRIT